MKILLFILLIITIIACKKADTNPTNNSTSTNNTTNNSNNNVNDTCWLNFEKVKAACVEIDKNDVKWFAGNGGLYSFDNEKWNNFQNSLNLFNRIVINPFNLEKKMFMYPGYGGFTSFDGKIWNKQDSSNNERLNIFSAEYDNSGNLWVIHQHQDWKRSCYLFCINKNLEEIDLSSYVGIIGSTFIKSNNNILWIGGYGLSKFDITQNKIVETYNQSNSSICSDRIIDIAFDKNGELWIASEGGGISNFDGKNWINYNSINSELINNLTTSIAVDKFNNVWVGTIAGLSKYNGSSWTNYSQINSKLLDNHVLDIVIDKQDNKWIVTEQGVSRLSKTK
jgi:ligand-binding sensor domain-containing protein